MVRSTGKADGDPDKSPDPVGNDDPDKLPDRLFFGNLFYTLVPLCAIALVHVLVMWGLPLLGMSVPEKLDGNPQIEVLVVQIASMGLLQSSWGCIVYSDSTTVMRILAVFVLIALCVFNGCYYSMIMEFVGELGPPIATPSPPSPPSPHPLSPQRTKMGSTLMCMKSIMLLSGKVDTMRVSIATRWRARLSLETSTPAVLECIRGGVSKSGTRSHGDQN